MVSSRSQAVCRACRADHVGLCGVGVAACRALEGHPGLAGSRGARTGGSRAGPAAAGPLPEPWNSSHAGLHGQPQVVPSPGLQQPAMPATAERGVSAPLPSAWCCKGTHACSHAAQRAGRCVCVQEEGRGEGEEVHQRRLSLHRRRSTPLLLNYTPLDFMEALSEGKAFNGDAMYLSSALPWPGTMM